MVAYSEALLNADFKRLVERRQMLRELKDQLVRQHNELGNAIDKVLHQGELADEEVQAYLDK